MMNLSLNRPSCTAAEFDGAVRRMRVTEKNAARVRRILVDGESVLDVAASEGVSRQYLEKTADNVLKRAESLRAHVFSDSSLKPICTESEFDAVISRDWLTVESEAAVRRIFLLGENVAFVAKDSGINHLILDKMVSRLMKAIALQRSSVGSIAVLMVLSTEQAKQLKDFCKDHAIEPSQVQWPS